MSDNLRKLLVCSMTVNLWEIIAPYDWILTSPIKSKFESCWCHGVVRCFYECRLMRVPQSWLILKLLSYFTIDIILKNILIKVFESFHFLQSCVSNFTILFFSIHDIQQGNLMLIELGNLNHVWYVNTVYVSCDCMPQCSILFVPKYEDILFLKWFWSSIREYCYVCVCLCDCKQKLWWIWTEYFMERWI